jgi:tripartite-type tricarboxylate transporter receptor subunit TctC
MLIRFGTAIAPAVFAMLLAAGAASGQPYPGKPVRFVSPGPGGTADFTARLVSPLLTAKLGQPVVVENRALILAADTVAKAPADGHTVLIGGATIWLSSLLQKTPYDPVRDFAPITLTSSSPCILVTHPSVPVSNVRQLIALAKARRGELNYSSSTPGSSPQLAGELFKSMAGLDIVAVKYKGSAPALLALLGGEVHITFAISGEIAPYLKAGRLKALAVTSAKPFAMFPGVPPLAATLPGYEFASTVAMLAPANTPAATLNRLNQEMVQALNRDEVKEQLLNLGVEVVTSSPQDLGATMKSDLARIGKLIKDAGIRADSN